MFLTAGSPKPPVLKINYFDAHQNELTKLFENADTAEKFVGIWKANIAPNLSAEGIYSSAVSTHSFEEAGQETPSSYLPTKESANGKRPGTIGCVGESASKRSKDDSLKSLDAFLLVCDHL